jgi:hypothetical protein
MKAFWGLEIIFSTIIFLLARTLATILYTPHTKLIGWNSLRSIAPAFFGIGEMKVALRLFFKYTSSVKIVEDIHNVYFEHLPTSLEETYSKTIRTGSLVTVKGFYHLINLNLLEGSLQPNGLVPHNGLKREAIQARSPKYNAQWTSYYRIALDKDGWGLAGLANASL